MDPGLWNPSLRSGPQNPLSPQDPPPPAWWPKKTTILGGCGAKLWGSGGAPPTNLILLRNQPTPRSARGAAARTGPAPLRAPPAGPPRPPAGRPASPRARRLRPLSPKGKPLFFPCGSSGAAPRGVAWPGSAFPREPPCLRPAVGRPPPRLPPIACSCGGALGGRLCPLRRQPRLLPRGTCSRCALASTLRLRRGECPEIFLTPPPPTVLHRTRRMARRMRGSERSEDPAHLPTDRGLVMAVHSHVADIACADCNLQSV